VSAGSFLHGRKHNGDRDSLLFSDKLVHASFSVDTAGMNVTVRSSKGLPGNAGECRCHAWYDNGWMISKGASADRGRARVNTFI
jgi:hypothetical protein